MKLKKVKKRERSPHWLGDWLRLGGRKYDRGLCKGVNFLGMDKSLPKDLRKRLNKNIPGQTLNKLTDPIVKNLVLARRARALLISSEVLGPDVVALERFWVSKLSRAVAGTLSFDAAVLVVLIQGLFPKGEAATLVVVRMGGLTLAIWPLYFLIEKGLSLYLYHRGLPAMRVKYVVATNAEHQ